MENTQVEGFFYRLSNEKKMLPISLSGKIIGFMEIDEETMIFLEDPITITDLDTIKKVRKFGIGFRI